MLRKAQVKWAGHAARMPDSRLPKRLSQGELAEGARKQSGQKKRYMDTLKASLWNFNIQQDT